MGEEEPPAEQDGAGAVGKDGQGAGRDQGCGLAEGAPPVAASSEDKERRRRDQGLADLRDGGRRPQHDPACYDAPPADGRCQSRMAMPATIRASNQTSGMIDCSLCSS